jgi:hypothetical protein
MRIILFLEEELSAGDIGIILNIGHGYLFLMTIKILE